MLLLVPPPGVAALALRPAVRARVRPRVLLGGTVLHAAGVAPLWAPPARPGVGGWLALDAAGLLSLSTVSAVFLASAVYVRRLPGARTRSATTGSSWAACWCSSRP